MNTNAAVFEDIRDAFERGHNAIRHLTEQLMHAVEIARDKFVPALEKSGDAGTALIMLEDVKTAMDALGNILNNMDCVDDEDERVTTEAFKVVRRTIRKYRNL